jgi:hypothetical protein
MARKERRYHYIYKITCLKNNRYYIGMHSTDNLEDGYMGGGKRIKNSVKKHGRDAHKKEILEFFESREDLVNREIQLVNEDLINDPMCMNLVVGGIGGGGWTYDQLVELGKRGRSRLKELWEDKDPNWINPILEKLSTNARERIIKNDGKNWTSFSGFKHKEESKELISKSKKGTQVGSQNSQFNTCWIRNNETMTNMKINKKDLDDFLRIGWERGIRNNYSYFKK